MDDVLLPFHNFIVKFQKLGNARAQQVPNEAKNGKVAHPLIVINSWSIKSKTPSYKLVEINIIY